MIRDIACDVKELILSTAYVNTHFEYCELVQKGDMVYPAQYNGLGQYVDVFNNDVNGNSYLRKDGNVSFQPISGVKAYACGSGAFVQMTFPFRLVMIVPKEKLSDDAFSDDMLAHEIIALLNNDLSTTLTGVRSIDYVVNGYDTDSLSVWSKEVRGVQYQMNFRYSYISVNFSAVVIANMSCFNTVCYGY